MIWLHILMIIYFIYVVNHVTELNSAYTAKVIEFDKMMSSVCSELVKNNKLSNMPEKIDIKDLGVPDEVYSLVKDIDKLHKQIIVGFVMPGIVLGTYLVLLYYS